MRKLLRRPLAGLILITYVAGCTHTPTGQKAFETFDQCIAANLGIATAGGLAIGALGKALARQVTGDRGVQNRVAAAAGVGAAVMIGLTAWKKCAAVYNRSEVVQTAAAPVPPATAARRPGLAFDRLDVRVEGTENDPPVPEFDFVYTADNPSAQDIKAVFRHKVEIVRFKTDDNDQLILADAAGETMRDSGGRPIPLASAMSMPRERLAWVSIAEEGKDDYVEDVVIQQGRRSTFRHRLQVPPRAQLPIPLPVPMRYTVTLEVDTHRAARTVNFALLSSGERPRRFASVVGPTPVEKPAAPASAPVAAPAPVVAPAAPSAASPDPSKTARSAFGATHALRRGAPMYDQANVPRKSVGRLNRGQPVQLEEQIEIQVNNRPVQWAKVITEDGKAGWIPTSELQESK